MLVLLKQVNETMPLLVKFEDFIRFLRMDKIDVTELNEFKRTSRVGDMIEFNGMEVYRIHQTKAKHLKDLL
jgi:hypothetical protein